MSFPGTACNGNRSARHVLNTIVSFLQEGHLCNAGISWRCVHYGGTEVPIMELNFGRGMVSCDLQTLRGEFGGATCQVLSPICSSVC